jgi:hypothetical protein
MWSTSAGGDLMKVVNLTGFTVFSSGLWYRVKPLLQRSHTPITTPLGENSFQVSAVEEDGVDVHQHQR